MILSSITTLLLMSKGGVRLPSGQRSDPWAMGCERDWHQGVHCATGHCKATVDSLDEMQANCSLGIRMYCRNAVLCHLPKACIVESLIPANAADVAAPMRESSWRRPRDWRTWRTCCTSQDFVTGCFALMKNGPCSPCRILLYSNTASTGHMGDPVRPTITSTPCPTGRTWTAGGAP